MRVVLMFAVLCKRSRRSSHRSENYNNTPDEKPKGAGLLGFLTRSAATRDTQTLAADGTPAVI